jgi:hypothetical protein
VLKIGTMAGYDGGQSAGGGIPLLPERWTALVSVGRTSCASAFAMSAPPAEPGFRGHEPDGGAGVTWRITARLVESHGDRATVDLEWQRTVLDPTLVPNTHVTNRRQVELEEGAESVLDLVTGDPSRGQCGSFAVIVALSFWSEAYTADAAIAYDMWLVQTDNDGHETVERFQGVGRQGKSLDFFFRRLAYAANGARHGGTERAPIEVRIGGTVRGSTTGGGVVDLTLDADRSVASGGGTVGTFGRKQLSVRSGETVEFEVPAKISGDLPGVGSLSTVFGRSRTAIRVTPRVLWIESSSR